jgi:DNA-binding response OmpR family regulator
MTKRDLLIVDDDEAIRSLLRLTLSPSEFEVSEAQDGTAALEAVARTELALVILDWHLPGASGSEVLAELQRSQPGAPVIVLTVDSREEERELASSLGAAAFLTKPFSPLELLETVERLLPSDPDPNPR